VNVVTDEAARTEGLLDAQARAGRLFEDIARGGLIRPGISEQGLSEEIYDLARENYGVVKHWHKRIVRSGPNTLLTYREKLDDRVVADDDILFLDLGPIFEEWEADFGRTFVLGGDPVKLRLRDDLAPAFEAGKHYFATHPDVTGAELYTEAMLIAREAGWAYGGPAAGHLVGQFPHEGLRPGEEERWIAPENRTRMRGKDHLGRDLHWILEIHLVDRGQGIGGFYEELLTL